MKERDGSRIRHVENRESIKAKVAKGPGSHLDRDREPVVLAYHLTVLCWPESKHSVQNSSPEKSVCSEL